MNNKTKIIKISEKIDNLNIIKNKTKINFYIPINLNFISIRI